MRQSRRYPNNQAGVEGLVEMLLHPVDRRLRRKLWAIKRRIEPGSRLTRRWSIAADTNLLTQLLA
jgi:hypothetical protein